MRRVTAPDGREWKVGRQWLPERVPIRRREFRDGGGGDSVPPDAETLEQRELALE